MRTSRQLADTYRFSGFRLRAAVRGILGDPKAGHLPSAPREKPFVGSAVENPGFSTIDVLRNYSRFAENRDMSVIKAFGYH